MRRLISDPGLTGVTHVIVDEVHERSLDSDLLLMLLRSLWEQEGCKAPKIVLMSATADSGLYSAYFSAADQVQSLLPNLSCFQST